MIPEGTEYVPGSMKMKIDGVEKTLTDQNDNDAGSYKDKMVNVKLGIYKILKRIQMELRSNLK